MKGPFAPPANPRSPVRSGPAVLLAWALVLLGSGCLDNPGIDPPVATLHFPIAMELHEDILHVANSNFDLRFNAGSVHAYRASAAVACTETCRIADGCVIAPPEADLSDADDLVIHAEHCDGLLTGEVLLGSFASGFQVGPTGDRLYMTSRSEADLSHIITDADGRLACGDTPGTRHRCTTAFRTSDQTFADAVGVVLPLDPVGLHAGPLDELAPGAEGTYALVAHRNNAVSLFIDFGDRPILIDVLTGLVPVAEGETANLENLLWHPKTQLAWIPQSAGGLMGRVGVVVDPDEPLQSYLYNAGPIQLRQVTDTRDVAFDPRPDVRRAYVLARQPQVLLRLDLDAGDQVSAQTQVQLCSGGGPSRIELATISDRTLAFVSCFDTGRLHVIDVDRLMLLNTTRAGQGPFVMAVDENHGMLFVGDFINSTVEMLSLAPLIACLEGVSGTECAPEQHGLIGIPRPAETLQ
jgi:hypothetical protein